MLGGRGEGRGELSARRLRGSWIGLDRDAPRMIHPGWAEPRPDAMAVTFRTKIEEGCQRAWVARYAIEGGDSLRSALPPRRRVSAWGARAFVAVRGQLNPRSCWPALEG